MIQLTNPEWWCAALVRAVKTFAQSMAALIGTNAVSIVSLDWVQMLGVGATAALLSILTSLAGLPEVDAAVDVPMVDASTLYERAEYEEEGE